MSNLKSSGVQSFNLFSMLNLDELLGEISKLDAEDGTNEDFLARKDVVNSVRKIRELPSFEEKGIFQAIPFQRIAKKDSNFDKIVAIYKAAAIYVRSKFYEDTEAFMRDISLSKEVFFTCSMETSVTQNRICQEITKTKVDDYKVYHLVSSVYQESKLFVVPVKGEMRINRNGRELYFRGDIKSAMTYADPGYLLAPVYLMKSLRTYLKERWEGLSCEELEEDVLYCGIVEQLKAQLSSLLKDGEITLGEKERPYSVYIERALKIAGLDEQLEEGWSVHYSKNYIYHCLSYLLYLLGEVEDYGISFVSTPIYGGKRSTKSFAGGMEDSIVMRILMDAFSACEEEKAQKEYFKRLNNASYARSFEDKKTVSAAIKKAMKESPFLSHFRFVEYDNECDIEKIGTLYKEFFAIKEHLLLEEEKDVCLRFRKLGNHKAAGLYYPAFKCICIDVDNPSSFIHEYLHMLDYKGGCLSMKNSFRKVKELYKEEFLKAQESQEVAFKGKYNQDYYFTATEIFARCGEMYLHRVRGISNSLLQKREGVMYPESEKLMEEICAYFDRFFNKKSEGVRKEEREVA